MSAAPIINGQALAHEQPQRYGWDSSGPYLIRSWHGTRVAIAAQYSLCVADGAFAEVKQGIALDSLEARYAIPAGSGNPTTDIVDNWEFSAGVVEKDFLEADISAINSLDDADRTQLRNLIVNPPATSDATPAWESQDGADLYALVKRGLRSVRVNHPILRHTLTVGSSYAVKASMANVGQLLSTAKVIHDELLPTDILFNLPATVYAGSDRLVYAWFKMHPTVRVASRSKTQIEQEWEYGLWPTVLLGNAL